MSPIPVTDPADPRLEPYRDLQGRAHRPDPRRFIAETEVAVLRLLASGMGVESVVATAAHAKRIADRVPHDVPLYTVERELLRELVGFDLHRGCAACGHRPSHPGDLAERVLSPSPRDTPRTIVVAQGLADPVNVGSLIRNCRAFTVDLLLLDAAGADPLSRRSIRASVGHVFTQPMAIVSDLPRWVAAARAAIGATVLAATVAPDATPVGDLQVPGRWLLMVGNEGSGLSGELLHLADTHVTIPIDAAADSLNVAAATAVLLHVFRTSRASSRNTR